MYLNLMKNNSNHILFCLLLNFKNANIFNTYITSGHSSVVERLVANEKVVGSSPIARSKKNV